MTSQNIAELKKTFKPESCTITKMEGIVVDIEGNALSRISTQLLTLDEEMIERILKLVRYTLTGIIDEHLMNLKTEEADGLEVLMKSDFENNIASAFLEQFRRLYRSENRYVLLLFKAAYDIPAKSSDGKKLEDGLEVYEHIVGIVCPIRQTKGALGYSGGKITLREKDWILSKPEVGFLYPDFEHRNDRDRIMIYYSDPKEPNKSFGQLLGCEEHKTMSQIRAQFEKIVDEAAGQETGNCLQKINAHLEDAYICNCLGEDAVSDADISAICKELEIRDDITEYITEHYANIINFVPAKAIYSESYAAAYKRKLRKEKANDILTRAADSLNDNGEDELAIELEKFVGKLESE